MTPTTGRRTRAAERLSGQLLIGFTYVAVGLLVLGVLAMAAAGISALDGGPAFDLTTLPEDLAALGPASVLWLGLLAVIAAPICRVIVAGVAYAFDSDWRMVAISIGILGLIAIGVITALTVTL